MLLEGLVAIALGLAVFLAPIFYSDHRAKLSERTGCEMFPKWTRVLCGSALAAGGFLMAAGVILILGAVVHGVARIRC